MTRGRLRVYLGCAPGVGKTFAMLDEGHRREARGTDVVVAFVETHGRVKTVAQVEGLELVPRRSVDHRGARFDEMDLVAVLARSPQVALVDELAHTNVPGSSHAKRWEDVEQLLCAGIDVVTTVNVQHLESLNDVVQAITGVPQRETVPDAVVRGADQIELVDMSPESLRRRMAHGNVYAPEKVDAALGNYFRIGNLTALRELALVWLAGNVEDSLQRYREEHGIGGVWETRERIVVALTGGPEGDTLLRRAARIASRGAGGGDLMALHVARSDGLSGSGVAGLAAQRLLAESLGGSYHSVVGDDVPAAILSFARSVDATQVVLGASRRGPLATALSGPGRVATITRDSGPIDVHVVSHDYVGRTHLLPPLTGALSVRRRLLGALLAAVLLGVLTPLCVGLRSSLDLSSDLLLFLLAVVLVSIVGGFWPALAAALLGSLLVNYYLVPPLHGFTIAQPENILALLVFLLVAASVSRVVDLSAARSVKAARAAAEAETISALAGSVLRGEDAVPALLERLRETFAMKSVALLRRTDERSWELVAAAGDDPATRPEDADVSVGDDLVIAMRGRGLPAGDQRVLAAFAAQVVLAYRQRQLTEAAAAAGPLAASARLRTALLNAVSHDLRTPLASAKAAVSSLRDPDVRWSGEDERELLANADTALDRLTGLVTDLLDLSRLQADALPVALRPVFLDDVVSRALDHLDVGPDGVRLDVPDSLPAVAADPGLLERVVANVIQNALRYAPPDEPVRLAASEHGGVVELRVIDRGPGIPEGDRERAFAAFQRADERSATGVGLGLAIARGFTEAMDGELRMEDTPGGGLTLVVALPVDTR